MRIFAFFCVFLCFSCSLQEKTEEDRIRKKNCKGEYIYRQKNQFFFPLATPSLVEGGQNVQDFAFSKITKESFRCKGSSLHLTRVDKADREYLFNDCDGTKSHGLPFIHGREGVYPILIDLLNYLQKKTLKKVVITSGHRCSTHHAYIDVNKEDKNSKHLIGAEVDFYIQGMENQPQKVIDLLIQYYKETPKYKGQKDFEEFLRYNGSTNVSTKPWYNKEVFLKLYSAQEGRNLDNKHAHPYLGIQVRFDQELQQKVSFSQNVADSCYFSK